MKVKRPHPNKNSTYYNKFQYPYKDNNNNNKLNKQKQKHNEKIEKSKKVTNLSRRKHLKKTGIYKDTKYYSFISKSLRRQFINKKYNILTKKNRQKMISQNNRKYCYDYCDKRPDKKINQKQLKSPKKCSMGECVVCMESKEMSPENKIKCHNTVNILCNICRWKMKENNCPLCKSHPIRDNDVIKIGKMNSELYINYLHYIDASIEYLRGLV